MKRLCFVLLTFGLFWMSCVPAHGAEDPPPVVKSIEVEGNRKIDTNSIKARIDARPGTPLSMDTVRRDIRELFSIGYFDDVRVDIEPYEGGVRLLYVLAEKPSLAKVEFVGNKEISEETIRKDITLTAGSMADFRLINDNVEKLRLMYESEGFLNATVFPILRVISESAATLTFQVEEGEKVKVDEINFTGNTVFTDSEIKKVMQTKEASLFSFITGSGKYVRAQMKGDQERIRNLYQTRGYIQSQVSEPELQVSDDREELTVTLKIQEGLQFSLGKVSVTGVEKVPLEEVQKRVTLKSGEVFNRDTLRSNILAVSDYYADQGYSFADVVPDLDIHEEERLVDIEIDVAENQIVRVNRINIIGNTSTRDKVIRREVRLDEGDIFHPKKLKRSYSRINNLNYFDAVEVIPEPRPAEGTMDITVRVKERPTGSFSIGGGYSSLDGFIATGEITEGNLFGRGQTVKLKGELGGRRQEYYLRFTEPWLFDRPISFDATLYNQTVKYIDYSKEATGFSVTFGKWFTEYTGGSLGYSFERANIRDVAEDASELVKDQAGKKDTSKVMTSLKRDSVDNRLYPRDGSLNAIYADFAGLGGDNGFYSVTGDSGWHFPLFTESAFSVRGRVSFADGILGKELPLYERFYVGGINSVRGHEYGKAGPQDEFGEYIGGNKQLIFNVEYTFPIVSGARLYGVIFYDWGAAFNDGDPINYRDMRDATGAGVRWISPMGPLRLEWGKNLDQKADEDSSRFEFTFGTFF